MQRFRGAVALTNFRARKLLAELQKINPSISVVTAEYLHFVDAPKSLTATEVKQLTELLAYGAPAQCEPAGELFLVVPRLGTISPWSSKATDIAHNCGLDKIRRIERGVAYYITASKPIDRSRIAAQLHDRMIETVLATEAEAEGLFAKSTPRPIAEIDILGGGRELLLRENAARGLAIGADEIDYLIDAYRELGRNPTDAELMMFGQVNSEHCRHKIFNADWVIDGERAPKSLFKMIKNTHEQGGEDVLSAYSDNAAILKGHVADRLFVDPESGEYQSKTEPGHIVIKVETHNHPTAIAPFPGAATGVGGEIRDEGATGRGAKCKMGLAGFHVSNLRLPGALRPWEAEYGKPARIASAYDIMIDAPLGGAAFNNEYGRANLGGYFRTYEQADAGGQVWGYHKPIMIAGGLGVIRDEHLYKQKLPVGAKIVVLGGPAMLIGLGGGSGASMQNGESQEDLDFASVQRGNGEMERRAQEVINQLIALGPDNPILMIHDVGAGGWSNALPELVHDSDRGARIELRDLPNAEPGLSPMEIWCNESQERYVLGVLAKDVPLLEKLCARERCPIAVVGEATEEEHLVVTDKLLGSSPVDLPMSVLFGKPPKMTRTVTRHMPEHQPLDLKGVTLEEAAERVLKLPAVSSKKFLITIGDRTVGGLTVRDQMVGPWQVPVSDVAVTASSFGSVAGEAMSVGERTPLAIINSPASARMAVGEAITNIAAADIAKISDIKLSANWMAAVGVGHEDEKLYDTVKTVGEDFCPELGITIPVGKDSLSMRSSWEEDGREKSVVGPLSLVISAFASVQDVAKTLTPQLVADENTILLFVDISGGKSRLGGSALAQVYNQIGDESPDVEAKQLKHFFETVQSLNRAGKILGYHDRSDGGLFATLAEMMFAGRLGVEVDITSLPGATDLEKLFNEELGIVLQIRAADESTIRKQFGTGIYTLGKPTKVQKMVISNSGTKVYQATRAKLESWWADTSYRMQAARDNTEAAEQEFAAIQDNTDPGISPVVPFELSTKTYAKRPKVAIFREEGVNGQVEMAAAFDCAGFAAVDVHLNDLLSGRFNLQDFVGLAVCGGFSYGDVLGAGEGWAKSILYHDKLHIQFKQFFERPDTFSFGVCNGCQMLSNLKELIPGAEAWPKFLRNTSEQFEARLVSVRISDSPSIMFKGMQGAVLPVPVAHGEGRAEFTGPIPENLVAMQYVDNYGNSTEAYPFNPNGSPEGVTALTTPDGLATILMPHPERAFLTQQLSWHSDDWAKAPESPWFKLFQNAREWTAKQ